MKKKKNIFWGLLLILGAAFILINKLGYFQELGIVTIIFTIGLAGAFIDSIYHKSFGGILFSAAFLCILYDKQLGIESITPWPVLTAALLGTIGLNLLFGGKKCSKYEKYCDWDESKYKSVVDEEGEDWVRCEASFSSTTKYINSQSFKKADLEVSFGSMAVYFDNAVLDSGKAVVNVEVSFGGLQLYVPKTWKVLLNLDTAFGGCKEYGSCDRNSEENVLMIAGDVSFSGVEIHYI